jgi:hypothetical protein
MRSVPSVGRAGRGTPEASGADEETRATGRREGSAPQAEATSVERTAAVLEKRTRSRIL